MVARIIGPWCTSHVVVTYVLQALAGFSGPQGSGERETKGSLFERITNGSSDTSREAVAGTRWDTARRAGIKG